MKTNKLWIKAVIFSSLLELALAGCKVESGLPSAKLAPEQGTLSTQSGGTTGEGGGGTGGGENGTITGGTSGGGRDGGLISFFKPALVVRATGCIMCHAKVEANIITDFGYGDPYYFGADAPGFGPQFATVYGDHSNNWQSAQVWGKIIVPQANVGFQPGSLADYLRNRVGAPDAMTAAPIVQEQAEVWIGAPTEARLRQVAGVFPPAHPQWKYLAQATGAGTGLELASGGHYVQNTGGQEFICMGDVVVDSALFLNSLQLRTDDRGCRMYVTGSVFIQGPINYLGTANYRNLQITSARAIVMGMGPGAIDGQPNNTLRHRLVDFWTRSAFFTRNAAHSTQEKLDAIYNDSSYIVDLLDSSAQVPLGRAVHFERIFLNAPNFQSRYQGEFKGVIVAEMAIGSLGQFAFKFDDVFSHTPILPLISQSDYLRVR